jgi:hypothetical protein
MKEFKQGIIYPSGFVNNKVWNDIERFNRVFQEEYNLKMF